MNEPKSKRSLANNTFYLFFGNGMGAVLSFGLIVILGRALGATGLGVYSTALAWVYPLILLAEFGLNTAMIRDLTQDLTQTPIYIRYMLFLRVAISLPCMIAIVIVAGLTTDNPELQICLLISAPLIFILPLFGTYSTVFRAYEQMALVGLLNFGMLLTQVIFAYLALTQKQNIYYFASINVITSAGQLMVAMGIYYTQFAPLYKTKPEAFAIRPLLKRAFPFAIGGILAVIQTRIGIILVERWVSPTEAGYFVVALRFLDVVRLLPMAHYDAIFPRLSSLHSEINLTDRIIWRSGIGLLGYGILATGITIVLTPSLVVAVFGEEYQESVKILTILAIGIIPLVLRGLLNTWAYATGYESLANVFACAYIVVLSITFVLFGDANLVTQRFAVGVIVTESLIFFLLLVLFLVRKRPR